MSLIDFFNLKNPKSNFLAILQNSLRSGISQIALVKEKMYSTTIHRPFVNIATGYLVGQPKNGNDYDYKDNKFTIVDESDYRIYLLDDDFPLMYMSCRIGFYNKKDIFRLLLKYKKWIQLYEETENLYSVQEVIENTIFKEKKKAKKLKEQEGNEKSEEEENEEEDDDEWEEEQEDEVKEEEEENEDNEIEDQDLRKVRESEEEWDEEWEEEDDDFIVNDGKSVDFEKEIERLTREDELFEMKNKRKLRKRRLYRRATEEQEEEEDIEEEEEEEEEKNDGEDEQEYKYRESDEEYEEDLKEKKIMRYEKFAADTEKAEESFSSSNFSASKKKKGRSKRIQKLSFFERKNKNYKATKITKSKFDKEKNRNFSSKSLHEQKKKIRESTKKKQNLQSKHFHEHDEKFESILGKRTNKYSSPSLSSEKKSITEKQGEFLKHEYDCSENERKRVFCQKIFSDSGSEKYFRKRDVRKKIKLEDDCEAVVIQPKDDDFYVIIDTESPITKKELKNIDGMKRLKKIIID